MNYTSSNTALPTLTLEDLVRQMEATEALLKRPEWKLIAPDGRIWSSADAGQLIKVLMPHVDLQRLKP